MIEAQGLSKFYGDFAACRDVSFQVSQGEIVAFLGPNGAGKSTTMKLLTGYISPSEGVARIAGHDMATDRWLPEAQGVPFPRVSLLARAFQAFRDVESEGAHVCCWFHSRV